MRYFSKLIIIVCIISIISCQSFSIKNVKAENEISKEVKKFSTMLVQKIYNIDLSEYKVLIMDFTDLKKRFTYLGTYISDKLSEELSEIENIKLINRNDIELLMNEISFQQTGLVPSKDVLKIGSFSGANILITGTITDLGDEINISAQIIGIENSEMEVEAFRIIKTSKNMSLISAIINVEERKEQELKLEIDRLETEIKQRKQYLQELIATGAKAIQNKLKAEEEQKREELDNLYNSKKAQIIKEIQIEEEKKKRELAYIEQQIREKSNILSVLKEKQKELRTYEEMIESIKNQIARKNQIVQYYIYYGMTAADVAKAFGIYESELSYHFPSDLREIWLRNNLKLDEDYLGYLCYSQHGNYIIIWSSKSGIVIGCGNRLTKETWVRSVE